MFLLKFSFNSMKGQKKDTLAKVTVLFLSFFFFTMSSLVFSSILYTSQQQRQNLYGNWQAIVYGADEDMKEALDDAGDISVMELVGKHMSGQLIGSIDEAVFEAGSMELSEGRLPETKDEILLVDGVFGESGAYQTGDQIQMIYVYEDMRKLYEENHVIMMPYILSGLQEYRDIYDVHFKTFWEEQNYGSQNSISLDELTESQYNYWICYWAIMMLPEFEYQTPRNPPRQFPSYYHEDLSMLLELESSEIFLAGSAYGADQGTTIPIDTTVKSLTIQKTYTVTGLLSPYCEQWDILGLGAMPEGFLSQEGAAQINEAIRVAEAHYPKDASVRESRYLLMLYNAEQKSRDAVSSLLSVYNQYAKPTYKLEGYVQEYGNFSGYLTGINPDTNEEELHYFYGNGNVGRIYTGVTGQRFLLTDLVDNRLRLEGFDPLPMVELSVSLLEESNTFSFRLNNLSYPIEGDAAQMMQWLFFGILIGITVCASFQIFWVQLRKRRNSTVTIMSIGATDGQVMQLMLIEIIMLLVVSSITGVLSGGAAARLLLAVLDARLHINIRNLSAGIGCSIAAVFAGALIPVLLSVRTPLTGKEQVSAKVLHLKPIKKKERLLRYRHIQIRGIIANRGRTSLQLLLLWLGATVVIITIFLCNNAFKDYRNNVQQNQMPDYAFTGPYAMSGRLLKETLGSVPEGTGAYAYITAENVLLHCNDILEESAILQSAYTNPLGNDIFEVLPDGETAVYTRIYGTEPEGAYWERLLNLLEENGIDRNSLNMEAIANGEEGILFVPMYRADADGNAVQKETDKNALEELSPDARLGYLLDVSYSGLYAGLYKEDNAVRQGDILTITTNSQKVDTSSDGLSNSSKTVECKVAAVIHYIKEEGIWPLTADSMGYALVSGSRLVYEVYPQSGMRMDASQSENFWVLSRLYYPDCYGKTYICVENPADADGAAMDVANAKYGEEVGMRMENLRVKKAKLYNAASEDMLMFLLLSIEISFVLLTILKETSASAIHQDSKKTGILQSLGINSRSMQLGQICQAGVLAFLSVIAANITMLLIFLANAVFFNIGKAGFGTMVMIDIISILQQYPWELHAVICLALLIIFIPIQSYAVFGVSRQQPIENIRRGA